jgi:hypothetical protein
MAAGVEIGGFDVAMDETGVMCLGERLAKPDGGNE